jgi:dipeptidyl aminopeptidase/acylaminoacyl peptidase
MSIPYGAWSSPITPELVSGAALRLDQVALTDDAVYWLEGRPAEGGRQALMAYDGTRREVTPPGCNVRTLAHEYGGGNYAVHGPLVFYANFADQRLYRLEGGEARPITPSPASPSGDRYADLDLTPDGERIYCVRERHRAGGEPVNELVVLPADGSAEPLRVASGHDFFSSPRVSPDGTRLCWLVWDHPRMPWDGTELLQARIQPDGTLGEPRLVAGGPDESIFQPSYSPDGALHYVSDRTGWWNLYRDPAGDPIVRMQAEFGLPQWVFGMATYGFLDGGRIACAVTDRGLTRVGIIEQGDLSWLDLPYTAVRDLRARGGRIALIAAGSADPAAVVVWDEGEHTVLARSLSLDLDARLMPTPEPITFPTSGNEQAHALYYPPCNPDVEAAEDERPQLLVSSHGGPTAHVVAAVSPERLYWTSRGFGVVEVNYRGSSGYGRAYRQALNNQWGIVDVEDCIAAARFLAERGSVDPARIAVRGGSAGGYTVLCALAFHDVFTAGVSYYGVGDLSALAKDTHKFESRYLDGLIGPWPQAESVYRERSPLFHAERIRCPVLLLQGLEDAVVPPAQAEQMVEALRARDVPHAYVPFAGEQHGFRRAETIMSALQAELSFYGQVFGFTPAGDVPRLPIEGLP